MTGAAIVRIPAPSGGARQAVATALGQVPLVVLARRIVAQLERECGGAARFARWVIRVVSRLQRPLALHDPAVGRTWVWGPLDWTPECLQGYLAGRHAELEAALGPIARIHAGEDATDARPRATQHTP